MSDLVGRTIAPVTARRGFATADLIAAWPAIAGSAHANCTAPEKVVWPRQSDDGEPAAGVLVVKVDGPRAIFVQHDLPQIVERVNAYLGYRAIARARIIQSPVASGEGAARMPSVRILDPVAERGLERDVADIDDERLRRALIRLGRGVRGLANS
ncbi:DUF721 domain-containing protein [Bauldia sp.]|uniref:DUF721 domain-containing protein n=1 Tax=Bauldia sp. TaxID=2575872 RepID=UPI003BABA978